MNLCLLKIFQHNPASLTLLFRATSGICLIDNSINRREDKADQQEIAIEVHYREGDINQQEM